MWRRQSYEESAEAGLFIYPSRETYHCWPLKAQIPADLGPKIWQLICNALDVLVTSTA